MKYLSPLCGALLVVSLVSCDEGEVQSSSPDALEVGEWSLSPEMRLERATMIKEATRARGLYNGILLAGVADTETGMVQCWSEATWACQGPSSPDCGGGPVIAGAGDGPCADLQGGLGMFQFDAGTHSQTLAREGDRILTVSGNVDAAVDFVVAMVIRSRYIDGVDTDEQAIAWMNQVRPWNALHPIWIQTVTHYYNGCVPGSCGAYDTKFANYSNKTIGVLEEMGAEFWYGDDPRCGAIPADGAVIDDPSLCFGAGGDPQYWRSEEAGFGGGLLWTNTTDRPTTFNYAVWGLFFDVPGLYLLEVHTTPTVAESTQARYEVLHSGQTSSVVVDQTAVDGFQALGEFTFASGVRQSVWVGDNTGEPNANQVALVVDALRVTPVNDPVVEPDVGVPDASDIGSEPDVPLADVGTDLAGDDSGSVEPDAPSADDVGADGVDVGGLAQQEPQVNECGCVSLSTPITSPPLGVVLGVAAVASVLVLRRKQ